MNCPTCGKTINENDTFCKNCGVPLTLKQRAFATLPQTKKIRLLKISDYFLMFLISIIPIINIITFIVWAASSKTNVNKKNYASAALIFMAIAIVLVIITLLITYYILKLV